MIYKVVFLLDIQYNWTNGQHILVNKIAESMPTKLEKITKLKNILKYH